MSVSVEDSREAEGPLAFNGVVIRDKPDMLSLTDMWKAAGSPENREPFNWARKEGAQFIDAVTLTHNLPDSQVMDVKRGKGGGTWAHWQIGLAYAKYLSPEFHMWCNTVVRERMEGVRALPSADDDLKHLVDGVTSALRPAILHYVKEQLKVPLHQHISAFGEFRDVENQRWRQLDDRLHHIYDRDVRVIRGVEMLATNVGDPLSTVRVIFVSVTMVALIAITAFVGAGGLGGL